MKRCLLLLPLLTVLAPAADAVSVAIVPDQASYLPGQTVTLTVTVDSLGAVDNAVFGRIEYDPAILLGGSASQNPLTTHAGALEWNTGFLDCGAGVCSAFNQVIGTPFPGEQGPAFVISTLSFVAGAIGTTSIEWTVGGPFGFDFFGLTDAPSATVQVVPEPATDALLALGLVALCCRTNHGKGIR